MHAHVHIHIFARARARAHTRTHLELQSVLCSALRSPLCHPLKLLAVLCIGELSACLRHLAIILVSPDATNWILCWVLFANMKIA